MVFDRAGLQNKFTRRSALSNYNTRNMKSLHVEEIQYDLRTKHLCKLQSMKTIKFGMESLSFRGSILWNNLNDEIKELSTVASFKTKIKTWMGEKYIAKSVNSLSIALCSRSLYIL